MTFELPFSNLQGFLRFLDFLCLSTGNDCRVLVVFKVFDNLGFFGICDLFYARKVNVEKSRV